MKSMLKYLILSLIIIMFSLLAIKVNALSPSTISVDISPLNPASGENTIITLNSFVSNLDSVLISWSVNGVAAGSGSGIGKKSFSIVAPKVGSTTTVRAVVALPDGQIEKRIEIKPNVMVLLWQATDSYVPPFYKGKAMPTAESDIKVVAMPEIKGSSGESSAKNMLYAWERNQNKDSEASGYGKNYFTYTKDYLEDNDTVSVTVSTLDGQSSSQASINVGTSLPQLSFYKNDTNLGIVWDEALQDGYKINGDEIIVAAPYFISPKETWNPSLVWNWFINGNLTNNTLNYRGNWLPIKVEGGISGTSTIRLDLENKDQLFGTASKEINVEF